MLDKKVVSAYASRSSRGRGFSRYGYITGLCPPRRRRAEIKRFTLLIVLSAGLLLTGTLGVAAPFDVTTADGNGADTYVSNNEPDVNHGSIDNVITWDYDPGSGSALNAGTWIDGGYG